MIVTELLNNARNHGTTGRGMDVGLINESGATIGTASLASLYATNDGTITGDAYGLFIGGQLVQDQSEETHMPYICQHHSQMLQERLMPCTQTM